MEVLLLIIIAAPLIVFFQMVREAWDDRDRKDKH